jgi:hypothetical protein
MIMLNIPEHATTIAASARCSLQKDYTSISRVRGRRLLGGVIFQNFNGASISMHFAGFDPLWINRTLLWMSFDYPFNQLSCNVTLAVTRSGNIKALEIIERLGFRCKARIPGAFVDGDMIISAMQRSECRWLSLGPTIEGSNVRQE